MIVNLGRELVLSSIAEPLIAPPAGGDWKLLWSSENPVYGGDGTFAIDPVTVLRLPGHSAVVLHGRSG